MQEESKSTTYGCSRDDDSPMRVEWNLLRPTQGAVGFVQVRAKKADYLALPDEKRSSFVQEQAIKVVRGPSGCFHVVDHHHWARAWHDIGMPKAPIRVVEDCSDLDADTFLTMMMERGWVHAFDEHGRKMSPSELPNSIDRVPDDPFQSVAAYLRTAGVFENPGEFNAKFAWADFLRQRITLREPTVEGFAMMVAEAFAASRLPEAKALPGFIAITDTSGHD